jgi:hypothetical protein
MLAPATGRGQWGLPYFWSGARPVPPASRTADAGIMKIIPGSPTDALLRLALFLAPVLLLVSSLAYQASGDTPSATAGLLQNVAFVGFGLVVVKLASLVAAAPRRAAALLLVGTVGVAGGIGYGVNTMAIGVADLDLNEDTGVAGVALKVFGLSFPICLVAFGLLLLALKAVPAPAALALSLGGLLFPVGRIPGIDAAVFACDVTLIVALSAIAITAGDRVADREALEPLSAR